MATVTINIPVDKEQWVLDGLAFRFGYIDNIANPAYDDQILEDPQTNPQTIPNPVSKAAFAKEQIIEFIKTEATQGYISEQWQIIKGQETLVTLT